MATTALSPQEVALVTNDKPVLVGSNAFESVSSVRWSRTNNFPSGTDYTLATHPISRVYDRYLHVQSKPNGPNALHYLSWDLGSSVPDWDCIFIAGHNFGTIGLTTCKLELATDITFGSLTEVHDFTSSGALTSDKRLVAFFANRYSSEQFVRLNMQKSGGGTVTPQIGELWLGRRRHLPYNFDTSLDDLRTSSTIVKFRSRSGIQTNYVLNRGQQKRVGTLLLENTTRTGFTTTDETEEKTVINFWSECEQGTKAFLFCAKPSSSPQDTQLMNQNSELDFPLVGPVSRRLTLDMVESAPYVALET